MYCLNAAGGGREPTVPHRFSHCGHRKWRGDNRSYATGCLPWNIAEVRRDPQHTHRYLCKSIRCFSHMCVISVICLKFQLLAGIHCHGKHTRLVLKPVLISVDSNIQVMPRLYRIYRVLIVDTPTPYSIANHLCLMTTFQMGVYK